MKKSPVVVVSAAVLAALAVAKRKRAKEDELVWREATSDSAR